MLSEKVINPFGCLNLVPTRVKRALQFTFIFVFLPRIAYADFELVSVDSTEVNVANELGGDFFKLHTGNFDTAYFFGNTVGLGGNLNTADRIPLDVGGQTQYFQAGTIIPSSLGPPQGSTRAYWFDSQSSSGASSGINFSIFDVTQDGTPDTIFMLDFGTSISEFSDDLIVSYAYDLSPGGINITAARSALIPEPPSLSLLVGLVLGLSGCYRRGLQSRS